MVEAMSPSISAEDTSLRQQVYDSLREALTAGRFVPGQKLTFRFVAGALGVSLTPVREALRRLLAEGVKAGEFRNIDPVLFYTSLIGACDHLFFGRHAMSRATGVGPVTDEVCRQYIRHMEELILGGMLTPDKGAAAAAE